MFQSGNAPGLVNKQLLDDVFINKYNQPGRPETATALDPLLFNQIKLNTGAYTMETAKGPGEWVVTAEMQDRNEDTFFNTNSKTYVIKKWTNSTPISRELFMDDNKLGEVGRLLRQFADTGRVTRDKYAMGIFRDAFNGNDLGATAAGVSLINASHTNANGDTVDNTVAGALTPTTLDTAITALAEQINESGVRTEQEPSCLLVPRALYKTASQILESEKEQGTANNDKNIYSSKYGIYLKTSIHLGATAPGGSDTAWFLLSGNHSLMRFDREGISTELVEPKYSDNDSYNYIGRFREQVGVHSYYGVVGSSGGGAA